MAKEKSATGTIKGVIKKYNDQSFEFTPFGKGEPVYEEQHKFKNGITESKTRGQNAKRVVRIPLDTDTPDIYDACVRMLDEAYPAPELKPRKKRTDALTLANKRARLMSWAFEMQKIGGELPIERLVDYTYDICGQAAEDAEKNDELIIEPKYKNTNRTVEASNVELHISVKSDNNENRLVIKFRR